MVHTFGAISLLLSLLQFALCQSVSGVKTDNDGQDYGDYYYGDYMIHEPPASNETLTKMEVELMIEKAVNEARHQILTDPELTSLFERLNERHLEDRRKCMMNENVYYDYVMKDCKSCLKGNCDEDYICKTECRNILKIKEMEEGLEKSKDEFQRIAAALRDLEDQQQNQNRDTWLVALTILLVLNILATAPVAVAVFKLLRRKKEQELKIAQKPSDDVRIEMEEFLQAPADAADRER